MCVRSVCSVCIYECHVHGIFMCVVCVCVGVSSVCLCCVYVCRVYVRYICACGMCMCVLYAGARTEHVV